MKETHAVVNTWNGRTEYRGTLDACLKYIQGNNVYQMNYSKLVLRPAE